MVSMKLKYENGSIRFKSQLHNCSDDVDMQILCNKVNEQLLYLEHENEIKKRKLWTIRKVINDD